ncbi:RluA family pseudouridine synthase [Faecalibacterium sp. DFI.5.82]|uniref:RluA family pseudouridine synthase n=1 Tax=Faecalibacterium sp. DFI.5.82 TaxID=3031725 RepID=UPI0023B185A3|nr:RluA family pseudouridine synthase [Faecalibacterium sp. DFI.5.82]MDE8689209.1 RluA family pseudouridine synthase [Faecalibacterium sp. DFI.5.82]
MEQREYIVEAEGAGQRIDRFLSGEDTGLSRSALQGLVAEGHVLCNGKAPAKSLKLKAGDIILLEIPDAKPIEAVPQEIPLDIIYEDAHLLVVNKPKGMVVHPAPGNPDGTLVNALLWHCKGSLSGIGGEIRPGIVHRIDKDTSGLLVVAKDDVTHIGLSQQMAVHSVERAYNTIVYGGFAQDEGFVESNLGRSKTDRKKMAVYPASEPHTKYAYTGYKVLERLGEFTMLECRLKTGRTHQIRVHMASIHHPVAGDPVYGPHNCITSLHGQCLHAKTLGFIHPITGEHLRFDSELPDYFTRFLTTLRQRTGGNTL